jgi:hypothetical protein
MRTFPGARTAVLVVGATLISMGVATPAAFAAAPVNDSYAGRVTLAVPSMTTLDTSEATTGARDAVLNQECGAPVTDASVWYRLDPLVDTDVVVDVSRSDYSAGLIVAKRTASGWRLMGCSPDVVTVSLRGGRSYAVLVFDYQGDGVGNGGTLVMETYVPDRRSVVSVTVDPTARFDPKNGTATVTGTMTCEGAAYSAGVEVYLRQKAGRLLISGYGGRQLGCPDGTRTWVVAVADTNGLFKGGTADIDVYAYASGRRNWSEDSVQTEVRMKR